MDYLKLGNSEEELREHFAQYYGKKCLGRVLPDTYIYESPQAPETLHFIAKGEQTLSLTGYISTSFTLNFQYSYDEETWTNWEYETGSTSGGYSSVTFGPITFGVTGQKNLYLRGKNTKGFATTGNANYNLNVIFGNNNSMVTIDGELMSIIDYENKNLTTLSSCNNYTFAKMFNGQDALESVKNLNFKATTIKEGSYYRMFENCTNLIDAPKLPCKSLQTYCYYSMFENCTSLTISPELPATSLETCCYERMFAGCTSLTTAPELPSNYLRNACYRRMFQGCTSLITAPSRISSEQNIGNYSCDNMFENCTSLVTAPSIVGIMGNGYGGFAGMFSGCTSLVFPPPILSASTFRTRSCEYMFSGCTSLLTTPVICANTINYSAFEGMFNGCTSLTAATSLPAVTLGERAYSSMFSGCKNLMTAPELPVTNLSGANSCYSFMFAGCESLTTAPALPATTLSASCYSNMFQNCKNLVNAPSILPATTLAQQCYYQMFAGCQKLITAPELPATTLISMCYGLMFQGCTKLNYVKAMFTTTPSMSYTNGWLGGVATTGTFVRNSAATWEQSISRGTTTVPLNWGITTASS